MGLVKLLFGDYSKKEVKRVTPLKNKVLALEEEYAALSDRDLQAKTPEFKERLKNGETLDDILPEAFAACREASWRVLGMKHFPVQIIGGIILHQGRIAEMRTGEGKTLVATLPAYLNALSGDGVHIVTVNDYLARRDSEWMGKVYRFMGLSVGLIVHGLTNEERQAAYNADITYGTNNEMGFDYLRDNMVPYKEQKVQRGHNFAVVDEVDSILIDEARTPLIISGRGDQSTELYTMANNFAMTLKMSKVKEIQSKENAEDVADGDFIVDEKARTATLTKSGVEKAEKYFNLDNLMDAENMTIQHHINQAIKAIGVMQRDIDYVVKDNQVLIVDEFTGRIMLGRRYNEGLHQAIEAKEGVKVEHESKTLATITFQNYFRLYKKLSGMTGTAMTESQEFNEIYSLDVVEIPTNKPMIRQDYPDVVYKTEKAKYEAIIKQVIECHEKGQPVLVGTISIEKSEVLSKLLKMRGIKHEVLNAKFHDKEAEIVAQAGKFGAVTIATNMAGRGTDIMLGGNSEFLAKAEMRRLGYSEELIVEATGFAETDNEDIIKAREEYQNLEKKYKDTIKDEADKVREAGGLFIIGTERHDSRRIDNQLRGRAGRQGDPGASRFYLSLEDDLMRLFGGERLSNMMNALNTPDDMPIESKMVSKSIESAQKKKEGQNFAIRKNTLQYDDVMNRQRELIYGQRNRVLDGEELKPAILKMMEETINESVDFYCSDALPKEEWNVAGLRSKFKGWLTTDDDFPNDELDREETKKTLYERGEALYNEREQELGDEIMRSLERMVLLRNVDSKWMDHIDNMDELRRGIGLRAYGQQDPIVAYRMESYDMFDEMSESIREETVRQMLTIRIKTKEETERKQTAKITSESGASDGSEKGRTVRKGKKVGPNDPCPCGSGKKYKKCCGAPGKKTD
ncbi:MAG: preprotein translocase subunit SecA [Ruminococcus sp.]|nr:preprotein translocase subunit SecA [Ruminococcus sp.]MDD7337144.1 preprotein translocase subunit SecA [Ruminococcus sp.]